METALATRNPHLEMDAFVAENSRRGVRVVFGGMHPASAEVKPNIASGIGNAVRREGIRSRSTGKERDQETGLDFFGARYMSAAQGRFTSPDEPLIDQSAGDPQSWNLYSYVRNNPLNAVDPTGQDCIYINDNSVGLERGNCSQKNGTYVNGAIDAKSFTYNSSKGTLGYSYTNGDAVGTGVIAGVYPSRGVSSSDLFGAVARGTQMAAPVVNALAAATIGFAYVATGAEVASLVAGGPGLVTLGRITPLLPAVPGAIDKLQKLGISLQQANQIVTSPTAQKFIDNANSGNINVFQDMGGKIIRMTLDPTGSRIISAGIVQARNVANSVASGRFTPLK